MNLSNISQRVRDAQYAVRGQVVAEAMQLERKLKEGQIVGNFSEIIYCNIGNPLQLGNKVMTFPRQVLSIVLNPELLKHKDIFPKDVIERAESIIADFGPSNVGAYIHSMGIYSVRQHVAKFIEERDNYPSNPDRIFLTNGASQGITFMLQLVIRDSKDGILIPIPQYPLYSATITLLGGTQIPYYLNESDGWGLSIEELQKSYALATEKGFNIRALVVINPGNPTGQILSIENQRLVVEFCCKHKIVLLADEVYQANVYDPLKPFVSFKKIACDMKLEKELELCSFHSCSKGYLGQCGSRGGYFEVTDGVIPEVIDQIYKVASIGLCSNVDGQLMVDFLVKPPKPGDESYDLFQKERDIQIGSLKKRAEMVQKAFNSVEGISCTKICGAMYAFPKIEIPEKAVKEIMNKHNQPADLFYCLELLRRTGIVTIPGTGFLQKDGTWHFRTTILPPIEKLEKSLESWKEFHLDFLNKFK